MLAAEVGLKRELDAFRKAVEARFGEEGARYGAGRWRRHGVHARVCSESEEGRARRRLQALCRGERLVARAGDVERLAARQTKGARLKP